MRAPLERRDLQPLTSCTKILPVIVHEGADLVKPDVLAALDGVIRLQFESTVVAPNFGVDYRARAEEGP